MSSEPLAPYVVMNGKLVPWDQGTIHVFSPAVKYGAGIFEGIRGYWNEDQQEMFIFRAPEHMRRLEFSQKVMGFTPIISGAEMTEQMLELMHACQFRETVHIRTSVIVDGYGESFAESPVITCITAVPRPLPKAVTHGVRAQVSSWLRSSDQSTPMRVKANANYNNGRFAGMQARRDGYDTAIMLNNRGKVSEGPSMCFFMVRDGVPVTSSITSDILESITRETLIQILRESFGLESQERDIDRSELYAADEAFFCGTGWEITPIVEIDGKPVGNGQIGPLTRKLQDRYFAIVTGETPDYADWRLALSKTARSAAAE